MNDTLWDYCQHRNIVFTRCRAYRKNDQAWVEQKNGAIVRKLIGYGRLEGLAAAAALRRLYEASRFYVNFFQPSFKLKGKEREGAKVRKHYHSPETPYRRLVMLDEFPEDRKKQLEQQFDLLDPVRLLKHIRDAQHSVMAISEKLTPPPVSEDLQKFVNGNGLALRRSTTNSSPGAQARSLVANASGSFCGSVAGLVELARRETRHRSQRNAETTSNNRLWRVL